MSRRRTAPEGRGQGRASTSGDTPPVRLPPSGLAHEILAALEHRDPTSDSDPKEAPALSEPTRIYSFADSLERQETSPSAPAEPLESWVTFELRGEIYALPVLRIREIQRAIGVTRVPNAPTPVRGIMNLRGKVLVVVDLRQRLGVPPAPIDHRSRILVVSSRERSLGLLVDAAHQVIKLPASRIEPPPADVMTERSEFLAGVVQLEKSLLIVLDIDQLLLVPEELRTQAEAGGPA